MSEALHEASSERIREILAAPPRPPADPARFSSNTLFGEPGIYPDGPPMVPAPGPSVDRAAARRALADLGPGPGPGSVATSPRVSTRRRWSSGLPTPVCGPVCSR